jgi:NADPH:quinone reductase-like Zn-dependent oxidoreductase
MTFAGASTLSFGGMTALAFLRHEAGLASGERVLIIGASGAVGSAAVQIAKQIGAEVSGVCSKANVPHVETLGADHVIDYTEGDYLTRAGAYHVIYDTVGATDFAHCRRALTTRGRLILGAGSLPQLLIGRCSSLGSGHRVITGPAKQDADDMDFLRRGSEGGSLWPSIDRTFPLERIVEAHAFVDTGRKRGSVVITV